MALLHKQITEKVLNAFYTVYTVLGYGFLEKVYENAMVIELTKRGVKVVKQKHIQVHYDGHGVGEYFADLLVEDLVIVEIKAAEGVVEENENQLVNYLKATDKEVGLLINFGKKPQFKRKIFENKLKKLR